MEQTTLQQRIEERAKGRLLRDLKKATELQDEIRAIVGNSYARLLHAESYYNQYEHTTEILLKNDYTKKTFEELLPQYISTVTDEILEKIDEIDYLLKNPQHQEQD